MCEFCTKHGEGKAWYLQMKNYSRELRSARLSPAQAKATGFETRSQWLDSFFRGFVQGQGQERKKPKRPPSPYTVTRRSMIVHFGQVIPLRDVEEILELMTSITRVPCGCRLETTGKADKRYCFGIGYDPTGMMGRYPDSSSGLEVLDREEAKKIFREFDREGLIHSIWTGVTPYVIGICNCDNDCLAYRYSIARGGPDSFFRAEYICEVNADRCTGCRSCMKQCQFGSQLYSHALGKVYIDPSRCYGCGLCMAVCSRNAIELLPRKGHPVAGDLWLKSTRGSRVSA
jgi:Pyruvate/2-oxoacid:ferredoxin oxidoreductase delta subunit